MKLITELYQAQQKRWPQNGRHIMAQYDADTIVVYQAFSPRIGQYAARQGRFGGDFSLTRMSWIKPNFLWMMYRCGWATKENQETVLAVSLRRTAFDLILNEAVASVFVPELHGSRSEWQEALGQSQVRLQWDPDHAPDGAKVDRRAIQLGLRGNFLARYAAEWIISIENITSFVVDQHRHVEAGNLSLLETPHEEVYPVSEAQAVHIGMMLASEGGERC